MSPVSFVTARLMETWCHGRTSPTRWGDPAPSRRLRHVAHIGVRARGFSYVNNGRSAAPGEVRVELEAPDGGRWSWGDAGAADRVTGPALDFCMVVTQRRHRDDTGLRVDGPLALEWVEIAQAFAGPPGEGRRTGAVSRPGLGANPASLWAPSHRIATATLCASHEPSGRIAVYHPLGTAWLGRAARAHQVPEGDWRDVATRATPADMADDVLAQSEAAGTRYIDLQFTDVMGAVKTVTIPADQLADTIEHGTWFDGSSVKSFARTAESDMFLVPDLETFRVLPWATPVTARLICWAHTPDGEPYPGDPRGALRRAIEMARELDFEYRCGPEIEFFLLRHNVAGALEPLPHDRGGYFDFATDRSVSVRLAMVRALQSLGIEVNTAHHEVAAGQHEIDFSHASALKSRTTWSPSATRSRRSPSSPTWWPPSCPSPSWAQRQRYARPPEPARHHRRRERLLHSRDQYGLSETAKHFIAGQLHHAAGMCAVLAPLVNSYKRLVRGFEAPVVVSWARTNRAALVRIPHVTRRPTTRVELRSPDPTCNPYLAYAVMLRCGLDGIRRKLPLPPPVEESLYGFDDVELERRNVGLLPDSLKDAIEAFRHDDVVLEALGDHLAERLLEAKELEWREYRMQVTPWELDHYLDLA